MAKNGSKANGHSATAELAEGGEQGKSTALEQRGSDSFRHGGMMDAKRVPLGAQEAWRMVGRIEAATMVARVSSAIETGALREIRDNHYFEQWGYGSFQEFCEDHLPESYSTYQERIQNLEAFGGKFIDWSERTGLGRNVMRSLRRLESGDIKAFVARVEAGQTTDSDMIAMAHEYAAEAEDRRKAEARAKELQKGLENERSARKKVGEKLVEKDEKIKKLEAEMALMRAPKNITEADKAKAVTEVAMLGSRVIARVSDLMGLLDDADVKLRAQLVGELSELHAAVESYTIALAE